MSYPIGTVATSITSDGSMPVWVKTTIGWSCMYPLEAKADISNPYIADDSFDSDWVFIQPQNPAWPEMQ